MLRAGLAVIPAAWVLLRPGVELNQRSPLTFACVTLLVALFSAGGGLALGCSVNQTHIGLMFSMHFQILQKIILVNPLLYAGEGLRGTLVPHFPHLSVLPVLVALKVFDVLLLGVALKQFHRKAFSQVEKGTRAWG